MHKKLASIHDVDMKTTNRGSHDGILPLLISFLS